MPLELAPVPSAGGQSAGTSEELCEMWVRTACTGTKGKVHPWAASEGLLPLHVTDWPMAVTSGFLWMFQPWHQRRPGPGSARPAGRLRRGAWRHMYVRGAGWSGPGALLGAAAGVGGQTDATDEVHLRRKGGFCGSLAGRQQGAVIREAEEGGLSRIFWGSLVPPGGSGQGGGYFR